jgi:soluble lytic murein transglycosylase
MKWTAQNKAAASLATLAFLATLAGLSLTIWSRQIKTLVDPKAALKAEQAATETFAKAKPNFANVLTDDAIVSSIPTAKEAKPPSGLVKSQPFGAIAPAQKPKPSVLELLSDLNPANWITQSNPLSDRAKRNETAPADPEFDLNQLREALKAYRAGDMARGDNLAQSLPSPVAKTALQWLVLRLPPRLASMKRVNDFLVTHPDWPSHQILRRRIEEGLYADKKLIPNAREYFASNKPISALGKLAFARTLLADQQSQKAAQVLSDVWNNEDLSQNVETDIRREFGALLTTQDHQARADHFFYRNKPDIALRAANYAGGLQTNYVLARETIRSGAINQRVPIQIPPAFQSDLSLQFAQIQRARQAGNVNEAAQILLKMPLDGPALVDSEAWWAERRLMARKLIDSGNAQLALSLLEGNAQISREAKLDTANLAGWIALRLLHDPARAAPHFNNAVKLAEGPTMIARSSYWLARTAEAVDQLQPAQSYYQRAAQYHATYYGQLARARLGHDTGNMRIANNMAQGAQRHESVKVVEILQQLGESEAALQLASDAARSLSEEAQLAALAQVMIEAKDARGTLTIGKIAIQRGFALDDAAFPLFGIPSFEPAGHSAETALVYAIARQESSFQSKAVSSAGAQGLMQLITSTAKSTAKRMNEPFDPDRLLNDPAFNAKLGAAHLGDLLAEHAGSMILTLAAYNAGGGRVREWIRAYGDPRKPEIDPIDWVERIPITETRNYVQRVIENVEMYRARLGTMAPLVAQTDLRIMARQFR